MDTKKEDDCSSSFFVSLLLGGKLSIVNCQLARLFGRQPAMQLVTPRLVAMAVRMAATV